MGLARAGSAAAIRARFRGSEGALGSVADSVLDPRPAGAFNPSRRENDTLSDPVAVRRQARRDTNRDSAAAEAGLGGRSGSTCKRVGVRVGVRDHAIQPRYSRGFQLWRPNLLSSGRPAAIDTQPAPGWGPGWGVDLRRVGVRVGGLRSGFRAGLACPATRHRMPVSRGFRGGFEAAFRAGDLGL